MMDIDLSKCKRGDTLIQQNGVAVTFKRYDPLLVFPAVIEYDDGMPGTRTRDGKFGCGASPLADIVAVIPQDSCSSIAELEARVAELEAERDEPKDEKVGKVNLGYCSVGDRLETVAGTTRVYAGHHGGLHYVRLPNGGPLLHRRNADGTCPDRSDHVADIVKILGRD